jgi:hypothetical protein
MPQNEHIELHRSVQNFEQFRNTRVTRTVILYFINSEQGQVMFKSRYRFYIYVSVSSWFVHGP